MNASDLSWAHPREPEPDDRLSECRYTVDVVARLSGVPSATVRRYERFGLIEAVRNDVGLSCYSDRAVERVGQIRRLSRDLDLNLEAIDVVLQMRDRLVAVQQELDSLRRRAGVE
jgi:DNA-binding transcriptional MerR regulator